MADLSYTVDVNATPAITALKKVETQVKSVNDSFGKLKAALAGIAFTNIINNTIQFADAIQDVSDATGIAVAQITGFSKAVALNGGTAADANTALLKFNETIGRAGEGAVSAQSAFARIGISLDDLATLSSEDIFARTVDGLGKITDLSEQARLKTELFGKSLRSTNLTGVSSQFAQATKESEAYASSIKQAADLQNKLDYAYKTLQQSILKAIEPMANFVNKLDPDQIQKIVDSIVKISVALGSIAAAAKGLQILGSIALAVGGAFATLSAATAVQAYRFTAFYYVVKQALPVFTSAGKALVLLGTAGGTMIGTWVTLTSKLQGVLFIIKQLGVTIALFATKFLPRLLGPIGIIYGAFEALRLIIQSAFDVDIVDKFVGYVSSAYGKIRGLLGMAPTEIKYTGPDTGDETDRLKKRYPVATEKKDITSGVAKQTEDIKKITEAFREQNKQTNVRLALEASLLSLNEDQRTVVEAIYDLDTKRNDAVKQLEDRLKNLTPDEQRLGLAKEIKDQIVQVNKEYGVQQGLVVQNIEKLQTAKLLEQDRLNNIQLITDAMQRQKDIAGVTSSVYSDMSKKLNDIMFGKEQRGRSIFEQQKAEIERNIQLLEADMAGAIMSAFETEDGYTNIQQMNSELQKMYDLTAKLRQEQLGELDISRQWATGWQDAFTKYMDSATNAATRAGEVFGSITQNMNSAIDNFVDNGKFKFSDFARSVIQDMIKIQLKSQATKLLSGASSFLGSLFGGFFAEGGNPPINKPSVVGENGPELFVPKTAGTIIPNGGGNGGSSGAAGGNTYITNNINALDAKSVAQLFAENRKTLFGTVELARKEVSYGVR